MRNIPARTAILGLTRLTSNIDLGDLVAGRRSRLAERFDKRLMPQRFAGDQRRGCSHQDYPGQKDVIDSITFHFF